MTEALRNIQSKLNAPKNMYNSFGKYSYRSCESILEAVKPLLKENGAELVLTDEIVMRGARTYVEATAIFTCGDDEVIVKAYAREPENKKGMDESQITGTASSYARKYALNGLFLIDDNKDADTDEHHIEREERSRKATPIKDDPKVEARQIEQIRALAEEKDVPIEAICERFRVGTLQDLTKTQFVTVVKNLEATPSKEAAS